MAISAISDGGSSDQISSPLSSVQFRCSGLERGTSWDRRLYALVGEVRT